MSDKVSTWCRFCDRLSEVCNDDPCEDRAATDEAAAERRGAVVEEGEP